MKKFKGKIFTVEEMQKPLNEKLFQWINEVGVIHWKVINFNKFVYYITQRDGNGFITAKHIIYLRYGKIVEKSYFLKRNNVNGFYNCY